MSKEIFYKTISTNLWAVRQSNEPDYPKWMVMAQLKEQVIGLSQKRGIIITDDDITHVGSCDAILGEADNYEDVINMWDKIEKL